MSEWEPADALTLILTGGIVVDPGSGVHEALEVGLRGHVVAAVGRDLPREPGTEILDVGGRYVTPGLVDLHTHLFDGISQLGVAVDATCLPAGVTTAVDAGTAGEIAFGRFVDGWLRPATTRTYAFVNLSSIGLPIDDGLEYGDASVRYIDVGRVVDVIQAHPEHCVGVKIRLATNQTRHGDAALTAGLEATDRTGTRLMVHITEAGLPLDDIFDRLRPGDIVTHLFMGRGSQTIVGADGRVRASLRRARERGVRMDVGHGGGSFTFEVARAALADGFAPDTISTDLHTFSRAGAMRDLPTTMAKFLALGMSVDDVVAAATVNAARSLGRPEVTGTLGVGSPADIAVLEEVVGPVGLEDTRGERMTAQQTLRAWATIRAGKVVARAT